jgi:threonine dehydrogenase-like Zn-dependent dehydrogenase
MRAITVSPGIAHSARLDDVPDPPLSDGAVLVRTVALGVCGTDREILSGAYGTAPPGEPRLVLGHESLGEVESAPEGCGLARGDLVVGIVRRPDPVPCMACAAGEWDMCRNGLYTERGIKERHGFGAERFRIEPGFAVKVDPRLGVLGVLLEPASILAKAWDHTERIGRRAHVFEPASVLVTGAGPIGLLAALMGMQRGLDVHVYDHNKVGPKVELTRALGATYHSDVESVGRISPDILIECTGVPAVIRDCLGAINRNAVLDNDCVFGTVNANRRHYEMAAASLAEADQDWLARLITRRVPLDRFNEALEHRKGDIKVIVDFTQ